jgi:DNA helicase-2/ATP-dependent DNA helicase PcrA
MDILDNLNNEQKEAVLQTEGPVLMLAGAGSGKTKALTHRIAYLIREKKISPYNILAVTFTNKAAKEMSTRVAQLLISNSKYQTLNSKPLNYVRGRQILNQNDQNSKHVSNLGFSASSLTAAKLPWMGTFHSVCVKILRREIHNLGYSDRFTIYDESESLSLIKRVMKEQGIDIKQYNPNSIKNFIGSAKNELINPVEYHSYVEGHFQEIVAGVYEVYQKNLKNYNALDFDDLIMKVVELFRDYPKILENYQESFKYILIDEYQDTNTAQYKLVKMLAKKYRNICVVGDDYQAIYGFRGANFKNILNFEKDYPDAKVIKMEQNYRSTQTIINAADKIIKQNLNRTDKTLWTENEEGLPITVYEASSEHDEVDFILNEARGLIASGVVKNWNEVAILYRTNAQSRVIEEVILNHSLPYRLIGAYRFYERKEIKDILSYLKYIANPSDKVSLERIINTPSRGIGKKTLQEIHKNRLEITNEKIIKFFHMMDGFINAQKTIDTSSLIELVINKSGYKLWLDDGTEEGKNRLENIEELKSVAKNTGSLAEFLEKVSLSSDLDNYNESSDAITLMTLHNAKGLEFPVVFIAGMEEGLFPHSLTIMEPMEMEEERRLCYVGITRAKKRLYLTHATSRMIFGETKANMRSRFIEAIPDYLLEVI